MSIRLSNLLPLWVGLLWMWCWYHKEVMESFQPNTWCLISFKGMDDARPLGKVLHQTSLLQVWFGHSGQNLCQWLVEVCDNSPNFSFSVFRPCQSTLDCASRDINLVRFTTLALSGVCFFAGLQHGADNRGWGKVRVQAGHAMEHGNRHSSLF